MSPLDGISRDNPLFLYIMIPGDLDPEDRTTLYANPLDEALEREGLGTITGGGSMDSEADDGTAEFVGVDVDLYDVGKGIAVLRRELMRLGVPLRTVMIYQLNGQEFQESVYPN